MILVVLPVLLHVNEDGGKKLVWAWNRDGKVPGETNIFIVDWIEQP